MEKRSRVGRNRALSLVAVGLLTIVPSATVAAQEDIGIFSKRFGDRVLVSWACRYFQGTNMGVIITREGLVLIDTGLSPTTVRRQRAEVERELGRSDFKYLINTHMHNDHAFANEVFPEAIVVAHESGVEAMKREVEMIPDLIGRLRSSRDSYREASAHISPESGDYERAREGIAAFEIGIADLERGITPRYPTLTFPDHLTLDMGDLEIELFAFGGLHSEADIQILLPSERILFVGDFSPSGSLPFIREESAKHLPRLLATWKTILDTCPEVLPSVARSPLLRMPKPCTPPWAMARKTASSSARKRLKPR